MCSGSERPVKVQSAEVNYDVKENKLDLSVIVRM